MPGRPEFSQPGMKGSDERNITQESPNLVTKNYTQNGDNEPGTNNVKEIYAPSGTMWRVRSMSLEAQAEGAATTGNHQFTISSNGVRMMYARSNYNDPINFQNSHWFDASVATQPNSETAVVESMYQLACTKSAPITVQHRNNTDATYTNARQYTFLFEEVDY